MLRWPHRLPTPTPTPGTMLRQVSHEDFRNRIPMRTEPDWHRICGSPGRVLTNAHVVAGCPCRSCRPSNRARSRPAWCTSMPLTDLADSCRRRPRRCSRCPLRRQSAGQHRDGLCRLPAWADRCRSGRPQYFPPAPMMVPDITGAPQSLLDVYQLAGNVQSGNSGGPLLDTAGRCGWRDLRQGHLRHQCWLCLDHGRSRPRHRRRTHLNSPVPSGLVQNWLSSRA